MPPKNIDVTKRYIYISKELTIIGNMATDRKKILYLLEER